MTVLTLNQADTFLFSISQKIYTYLGLAFTVRFTRINSIVNNPYGYECGYKSLPTVTNETQITTVIHSFLSWAEWWFRLAATIQLALGARGL